METTMEIITDIEDSPDRDLNPGLWITSPPLYR